MGLKPVEASFLSVGSSFKKKQKPPEIKPVKADTESESSADERKSRRKKEKKHKKHKDKKDKHKKRRHNDLSDEEDDSKRKKKRHKKSRDDDDVDERIKVVEFEKKRIRIDPRSAPQMSLNTITPSTLWAATSRDVFEFDVKGDPNNLVFGGVYRTDIPTYSLYNGKNPFYITEQTLKWKKKRKDAMAAVITYSKGSFEHSNLDDQAESATESRYFKGKLSKMQRSKHLDLKTIRTSDESSEQKDFISLEEEYNSDDENQQGETLEQYTYRRTREFNEKTKQDPYHIETWLEFIEFQGEFSALQKYKNNASISEKKLAIYEKALHYNPNSVTLLCGHLRESAVIHPASKVEIGWRNALDRVPDSSILWSQFFAFKKSYFAEFTVEGMRGVYEDAINTILDIKAETSIHDRRKQYSLEQILLQIFFDLCTFEKQSGYTERGIALLQAMIELNLFCPILVPTWDAQIRSFEDFWESEVPRFGEEGAQGWNVWFNNQDSESYEPTEKQQYPYYDTQGDDIDEDVEEEETEDLIDIVNEKSIFVNWLKEEEKRSFQQLPTPKRPKKDFEVVESCPDRIVLFDDIRQFMFPISSSVTLQIQLLYQLLDFLGYPILYTQLTCNDWFVQESLLNRDDSKHLFSVFDAQGIDRFDNWRPASIASAQDQPRREMLRNVFLQSIEMFPDEKIMSLGYVDFECKWNSSLDTQNFIKTLLSKDRNNLLLWNYYAQWEAGKVRKQQAEPKATVSYEEPKKIYDAVLSQVSQVTDDASVQQLIPLLFRCFVELELLDNNNTNALHLLCSCAEPITSFQSLYQQTNVEKPSNTSILRARKFYEARYEQIFNERDLNARLDLIQENLEYLMCYALFEYVINGVSSACKIFDSLLHVKNMWPSCSSPHSTFSLELRSEVYHRESSQSRWAVSTGDIHEQYLWMLYLKFIKVHVLRPRPSTNQLQMNRTTYRDILTDFLQRFPTHPIGMSLLIDLEQETQISSRMRRYLDNTMAKVPSPILFLYSIYAELRKDSTSTPNRIRSLFEKALEYQMCRSNVMIWRMYMRFETSQSNLQAAKRIFFRAVDKCPQAKVLWLDSVKLFKDQFSVQELKELIDLMSEKEIMMRSKLEEFVQVA
jgi:hypothetical protein